MRLDLLDVAVEQAERVGVGEHQAGHVLAGLLAQVVEVHAAVLRRADLDHLVARHRHGGRVGAVRGVGREHLGALLAAVLVVGAREQQAGELAVGARAGLERHVRQARRSRPARPAGATSARARPGRTRRPGAGAGARGRAAPPRARAAWGCASSCTSRAGRSPRRGGSSSTTASRSGAPARARRPRAARPAPRAAARRAAARRAPPRARRRRAPRRRAGPRCERSKIVTVSCSRGSKLTPPPPRARPPPRRSGRCRPSCGAR